VYAQGRYVEAEALTRECEEASRPNDVHSQILWRSIRAMTRAHAGDFDTARALAREAIAYASESDFYPACIDAHLAHAEVLELSGDALGAAGALAEALRFCELKGNHFVAGQARARLLALETERPG
jgi:ATP/maltotriose-dependent transcriptional regulator MalT